MSEKLPFGLKIGIINRAFRKKLDEKASAMGLTSAQLRVLASVSRMEESGITEIHQNDLERSERVTHPAMTKIIRKLEKKGFLRSETSQSDKRYKKITATDLASGIHKMMIEHDDEVLAELCRDFSADDIEKLTHTVGMLFDAIDKDC